MIHHSEISSSPDIPLKERLFEDGAFYSENLQNSLVNLLVRGEIN